MECIPYFIYYTISVHLWTLGSEPTTFRLGLKPPEADYSAKTVGRRLGWLQGPLQRDLTGDLTGDLVVVLNGWDWISVAERR